MISLDSLLSRSRAQAITGFTAITFEISADISNISNTACRRCCCVQGTMTRRCLSLAGMFLIPNYQGMIKVVQIMTMIKNLQTELTHIITNKATICQYCLKNKADIPS
ncbi:uncharacterized protein LOC126795144 [Argentina anserina]|uniref:uncharacterized protein LOC126795144 n=1 Tax=Argentina anserina TaxID=57926 RepID=UPI0021763235|nr:uncharacterized protein LOC126795144 [Potentilla anserina]